MSEKLSDDKEASVECDPPLPKKAKATKRCAIRERIRSEAVVDGPSYYIENGLRKVRPYWFHFCVFAKERWFGKALGEVFEKEMYSSLPGFFVSAIRAGRVTVNDQTVCPEYEIKNGDLIRHMCHRHELPVLDRQVTIIENTDDLLVVDKPCSLPIHPCGRYYFNSLTQILKYSFGFDNLKTLYRLDRLTSGVVVFLKNAQMEKRFRQHLLNSNIKKEYICLVEGQFPDNELTCDQPLDYLFRSMGLMRVSREGKPCFTRFRKLHTDGKLSIVKCLPQTGRTHQIRVHLQFLGYPIIDDAIYNCDVFGPNKGKNGDYGKPVEQLEQDVRLHFTADTWLDDTKSEVVQVQKTEEGCCELCRLKFRDPSVSELEMSLHCLRYSGPDWSFECPLPSWASVLKDNRIDY
ncbi:PseudoU synth 2 domain containing protein [Trichuris trichiura]|uniref:Pseudouridine synthase n=1 Tax=Trichuris trichiura TaxID=36087 RepID=A0A077ZCD5_TRITR|nr:PseudoU synth 2 domain containing protein [Trichuris trichiura]